MQILVIVNLVVLSIFSLFLLISRVSFKGGNFVNRSHSKYSFSTNYLCDLGRKFTFIGELNTVPQKFYRIGMTFGSAALLGIYCFFLLSFLELGSNNKLGLSASILGIFGTLFCVILAYIPVDVYTSFHLTLNYLFCGFHLIGNIILLVALFRIQSYPIFSGIIFVICDFSLLSYFSLNLIIKSKKQTLRQKIAIIVIQKIVTIIYFTNIVIQMIVFGNVVLI